MAAKKSAKRSEEKEARERLFTMRMSAEEAARFERVAKHYGLTVAATFRMLAKREDDAIAREAFRRPGRR